MGESPELFDQTVAPPRRTWRTTGWIWLASVAGWTLFSALLVLQDGISERIHSSGPINWVEKIGWEIGWTLWAPLMPCVLAFTRRHRISVSGDQRNWFYHACGAAGAILLQVFGETTEVFWLARAMGARPPYVTVLLSTALMRWHLDLLVYCAIVAVAQAIWFRREAASFAVQASRLETRLAEAKLDMLKSQIHPHFLFNTLHAIAALIVKREDHLAVEMLSRLSDFLRIVLDNVNVQQVSLKEELDLLRLYLEIQMVRFGDRLKVQIDIPSELLSAEVPYLLLQPLVENAIKHGVERYSSAGLIEVRGWQSGENVHLVVRNAGNRHNPAPGSMKERIGLGNTRQRLQLLYGEKQHVEIRSEPQGETVVEIVLPLEDASILASVEG
jgi:hypothetical protein